MDKKQIKQKPKPRGRPPRIKPELNPGNPETRIKKTKSDKFTVNQRVNEICELLIEGNNRRDIIKYSAEKGWGVSDTTVDSYLKKANDLFKHDAAIDRNAAIAKSRNRYELIFKKALKILDLGAAARAQKEIDFLDGLKAPKTIQIAPQKVIVGIKKG